MLADLISLAHLAVIAFVAIAPFSGSDVALLMHLVGAPGLLVHWATNQDVCALTLLEAYLRGVPSSETFLDRLVGAFYRLPGDLSMGRLATVATFLLWLVTLYRVFTSGLWARVTAAFGAVRTRSTRSASPAAPSARSGSSDDTSSAAAS